MKVQINGFITYEQPHQYDPEGTHGFSFCAYDPTPHTTSRVVVQPYSFEYDAPANFDPRQQLVKALEAEKEKARKEFANTVMRIDRQINELLALEHAP